MSLSDEHNPSQNVFIWLKPKKAMEWCLDLTDDVKVSNLSCEYVFKRLYWMRIDVC